MNFRVLLLSILLLITSSCAKKIVIENKHENILTVGYPNSIIVSVHGYTYKSLTLSTDNGTITQTDNNGHFMVVPDHPDSNFPITIKVKRPKVTKEIGVKYFIAKCASPPVAYLIGKKSGNMSAQLVHSAISPVVVQTTMNHEWPFRITGFTIIVVRDDEQIFNKTLNNPDSQGIRFSDNEEILKMIATLKPKDKLIIADIVYAGVKNCMDKVNSINLTITE